VKTNFQSLIDQIKKILKDEGQNYTYQREIIVKTLYDNGSHFTPEELHDKIKQQFPKLKIGIATIYRTLNFLELHKIVSSISFGSNGKKFELNSNKHHDHMICDECGKIIEFCDETIEELQESVASKHGFVIKNHTMQLHGFCKNCSDKIKNIKEKN
jgi:Fur family ferric uptake transcriptional regulator